MYWNHSFQFWWLIPVLMILMCFVMRRRGMAGCCMGGRGSRDGWRDLPTDGGGNRHLTNDPSTSVEEKTPTESLKTAVQGLEQRLRRLEERLQAKELMKSSSGNRS